MAAVEQVTLEQVLELYPHFDPDLVVEVAREMVRDAELEQVAKACVDDPRLLIAEMVAFDERAVEEFRFDMSGEGAWGWQREAIDWMLDNQRCLVLKARQLGFTWLACALGVWQALYRPGSLVPVYRQKEEDSAEIVQRMWTLMQSLPAPLWNGAEVTKPTRGAAPYTDIHLRFPDGKTSKIVGMTSAGGSGHGKTAALTIMDEFARIDRAGEIMKAVSPMVGDKGRLLIISTANGRHNAQTGEGNHFHYLWEHAEDAGLARRFFSYKLHPERSRPDWRDTAPEVLQLKPVERLEQYPETANEAFTFSQSLFFDAESLHWYDRNALRDPLFRGRFVSAAGSAQARFVRSDIGVVHVYESPVDGHAYAVGADVATGRGLDYSAAVVVDLSTMGLVAEVHGKLDVDLYVEQLHFLGQWFNGARIAVESAGGFGEPVIILLRDGKDGRPPYRHLYRHRQFSRADLSEHAPWGFPMNTKTRPQVLAMLEKAIREHSFPYLTPGLMGELGTFVYRDKNPSPAAADGSNDDRVMACAVAVEMYRQYGEHEHAFKREKPERHVRLYPWQRRDRVAA